MCDRFHWLWMGLLLLAGPAAAQNPKVTLKVRDATCSEATAALAKAAGVPLLLYSEAPIARRAGAAEPAPDPTLAEKSSFEWTGVPFGRALRQLCERYRLRPFPISQGFGLVSDPGQPARERRGLLEKEGVRLFLS